MPFDIAGATVLAAGIGAIVGGGISAFNSWLIRRSEERMQIRELAVRASIEEWKAHIDIAKGNGGKTVQPLDLYLIHSMGFIQEIDGSIKTEEQVRKHLRKVHSITDAAGKEIEEYSKN